eukprot:157590-Hanusia_phi.AAC.3
MSEDLPSCVDQRKQRGRNEGKGEGEHEILKGRGEESWRLMILKYTGKRTRVRKSTSTELSGRREQCEGGERGRKGEEGERRRSSGRGYGGCKIKRKKRRAANEEQEGQEPAVIVEEREV